MPRGGFSGSLRSPKIDVVIDMGNPFLNRTVDGFLKIGACKVAAEETFECLHRDGKHRLQYHLSRKKAACSAVRWCGRVARPDYGGWAARSGPMFWRSGRATGWHWQDHDVYIWDHTVRR